VRSSAEPEFVHCFINNEHVVFEISGNTEAPELHPESIFGITVNIRNKSLVWLEGISGWELLINLLKTAEINDEKYAALCERSMDAMFDYFNNL